MAHILLVCICRLVDLPLIGNTPVTPAGFRFALGRAHPTGAMHLVLGKLMQIAVVRKVGHVIHLLCDPFLPDCGMDIPFAAFSAGGRLLRRRVARAIHEKFCHFRSFLFLFACTIRHWYDSSIVSSWSL